MPALSDFNVPTGESLVIAGLYTSGGAGELVRLSTSLGSLDEGDNEIPQTEIDDTNLVVDRIRVEDNGARVILNKSGLSSWNGFFASGGFYEDSTWYILTDDGLVDFTLPAELGTIGTGFINLDNAGGSTENDYLADIVTGDQFVLALTIPAPIDLAVSFSGGVPSLAANAEVVPAPSVDLAVSFSGGVPSLAANAEVVPAPSVDLAVSFSGGVPSLAATLAVEVAANVLLSVAFRGGAPSLVTWPEVVSGPIEPDLDAHIELLIEQYSESTKFQALLRGLIRIAKAEIADPLMEIARGFSPDASSGILLDLIGARIGMPRPFVVAADATYFGFEGTDQSSGPGRTFGQAPFFSRRAEIENVEPLGDKTYRFLLLARARRLRGGSDRETVEAVLAILFARGYAAENTGNGTVVISVETDNELLYGLVTGSQQELVIPRTAGIAYTFTRL